MRLSFLLETSDRVELEAREADSDILKALESIAPMAIGGKWNLHSLLTLSITVVISLTMFEICCELCGTN